MLMSFSRSDLGMMSRCTGSQSWVCQDHPTAPATCPLPYSSVSTSTSTTRTLASPACSPTQSVVTSVSGCAYSPIYSLQTFCWYQPRKLDSFTQWHIPGPASHRPVARVVDPQYRGTEESTCVDHASMPSRRLLTSLQPAEVRMWSACIERMPWWQYVTILRSPWRSAA